MRLVDSSEFTGRAVEHDFGVILDELRSFSEDLADKPMIVVASKTDACQDPSRIEAIRRKAESANMEFLAISSVTGTGLEDLRFSLRDRFFKAERVIAAATLSPQSAPDPIRNH